MHTLIENVLVLRRGAEKPYLPWPRRVYDFLRQDPLGDGANKFLHVISAYPISDIQDLELRYAAKDLPHTLSYRCTFDALHNLSDTSHKVLKAWEMLRRIDRNQNQPYGRFVHTWRAVKYAHPLLKAHMLVEATSNLPQAWQFSKLISKLDKLVSNEVLEKRRLLDLGAWNTNPTVERVFHTKNSSRIRLLLDND